MPTHFGDLDLRIQPAREGAELNYTLQLTPCGDQARRDLSRIVLYVRTPAGQKIESASVDGMPVSSFADTALVIPRPSRGKEIRVAVKAQSEP